MPVMLFHVNNVNKRKAVTEISVSLGIRIVQVNQNDAAETVANLLAGHSSPAIGKPSCSVYPFGMPEFILFSDCTSILIDSFLNEYRKQKLESIALKAVVTPVNRNWTLNNLLTHLSKEHAAFSAS